MAHVIHCFHWVLDIVYLLVHLAVELDLEHNVRGTRFGSSGTLPEHPRACPSLVLPFPTYFASVSLFLLRTRLALYTVLVWTRPGLFVRIPTLYASV